MSYGLMDLASSVEGQARGGLRQAADAEHQRNRLNQQIDDAEAAEKRSLVGTAATVAADAGLNTYYAAAEATKAADAAQAALNAKAAVATDAIAAAETAQTVAATQEAVAGAKAVADAAAVTEATAAATTVAPTVAAPVAAGVAPAATGPLATMGPAGWAALAGLALYSFL
jgi:hypothetical protein